MPFLLNKFHRLGQTRRNRWLWRLFGILVLALVTGAVLYWWVYRKQYVREQLEAAVLDGSDGLYRVSYERLHMDELRGWIRVQHLQLDFDSTRYLQLVAEGRAPAVLLRIKIPDLTVSGVKTPRALLGKELVAGKIEILRPQAELVYTPHRDSSGLQRFPRPEDYERLLGSLNQINLGSLLLSEGEIRTSYWKTKGHPLEITNVTIQLDDIVVDSTSWKDTERFLFAKEVDFRCDRVEWLSGNARYRFRIDSLRFHSASRLLRLEHLRMEPLKEEAEFTRNLRFADDRFDIQMSPLEVHGFQLAALQRDSILADSIYLGPGHLHVYRDIGLPHDGKSRLGTYPHQLLARAGTPIRINSLFTEKLEIVYKERNAATRHAGRVQFKDTRMHMTGITNIRPDSGGTAMIRARINTRFMNQAPLSVVWDFYPHHVNGRFEVQGTLGALPAAAINQLAVPMGPARLDEGQLDGMQFRLSGHDYGAKGSVVVLYNNLKIAVLEKEGPKKLEKKGLASFAANLIIRRSNPSKKGNEPRKAEINYRRDTRRSIFNLSWKALFEGIKETVGG